MRLAVPLIVALLGARAAFAADSFVVHATDVADRKAVVATVEPVHQLVARARIGGTIASLAIKEGDVVAAGAEIAVVADQKLALQMQALDSRIASQQSQRDQAKTDFDRVAELQKRGVSTQTQLDQARTNLDVAERNLTAMRADRSVIAQQASEGAVLAPGSGRVLKAPVSLGQVILPGETIATLAEDQFILRLQLPERHARFMRAGDTVLIGARGMQAEATETMREGKVRLVYPEIQGGRVIADVEVARSWRLFRWRAHARLHRCGNASSPRRAGLVCVPPGRGQLRPPCRRRRNRRSARRAPEHRRGQRRRDPGRPQGRRHVGGAMKLGLSGVLTRAFINSPLTPLLLLAALVAGALAVFSLPREEEPQISVPMVDIIVAANGYKADEAVELVTRPLEDIVKAIDGVEHVYSQTEDDRVVVTARFLVGTDQDTAVLRVHEKIRAAIGDIPKGIPEPLIVGRGINDVAILVLTLVRQGGQGGRMDRRWAATGRGRAPARTDESRRRGLDLYRRRSAERNPG